MKNCQSAFVTHESPFQTSECDAHYTPSNYNTETKRNYFIHNPIYPNPPIGGRNLQCVVFCVVVRVVVIAVHPRQHFRSGFRVPQTAL